MFLPIKQLNINITNIHFLSDNFNNHKVEIGGDIDSSHEIGR